MKHPAIPHLSLAGWPRRSFLRLSGLALSGSTLGLALRWITQRLLLRINRRSTRGSQHSHRIWHARWSSFRISTLIACSVGRSAAVARSCRLGLWIRRLGNGARRGVAHGQPAGRGISPLEGARPSLFSATMLGHLEVVKAFVAAQPGVQRIRGPHGISLLAHAKAGGEARYGHDSRRICVRNCGEQAHRCHCGKRKCHMDTQGINRAAAVPCWGTGVLSVGGARGADPVLERRWRHADDDPRSGFSADCAEAKVVRGAGPGR